MNSKFKVIYLVSLMLVISFSGFGYYTYEFSKNSVVKKIIDKDLPKLSQSIKQDVELKMVTKLNLVSTMGNNFFLQQWYENGERDIETVKKYLGNIEKEYKLFVASTSSVTTNNQYTKVGIFTKLDKNDPFNAWFFSFIQSGKKMSLNITVDELRNFKLVAFINNIIKDDKNKVLGLATIGLDINEISKYILEYINENRNVYVINSDGYIIMHKDRGMIYVLENEQKNKNRNIKYISGIDKLSKEILSSKGMVKGKYVDSKNNSKIVISNYIPSIKSYLIVEEDEKSIQDEASSMFIQNFMISIFIALLVGLLVLILMGRVVKDK